MLQADSARSKRSEQKTRRNRKADREGGWTQRAAVLTTAPQADGGEAEDESIRLGRDRRRRFLNEKILRDMAGQHCLPCTFIWVAVSPHTAPLTRLWCALIQVR